MTYDSIQAVILAAGKSHRFHTPSSKLLEKICGQEMILYGTKLLSSLHIPTSIVIGHQRDLLQQLIKKHHHDTINFIHQEEQRGTGHAVAQTKDLWKSDNILILNGDAPLMTQNIIRQLITKHLEHDATITFATAHYANPLSNYGRVIKNGDLLKIIEARDYTEDMHESCCINAGVYLIKKSFLQKHIDELSNNNAAREYYITDLIGIANKHGYPIETIEAPFDHIRGINTLKELWTAEQIKRSEIISALMDQGVRFHLAQSTHVDINVTIGSGSSIGAGAHLVNGTTIGNNVTIYPFTILDNAHIEDNATVYSHCVIQNATIQKNCSIKPFSHIKDTSIIQETEKSTVQKKNTHHDADTLSFIGATKTHHDTSTLEK